MIPLILDLTEVTGGLFPIEKLHKTIGTLAISEFFVTINVTNSQEI